MPVGLGSTLDRQRHKATEIESSNDCVAFDGLAVVKMGGHWPPSIGSALQPGKDVRFIRPWSSKQLGCSNQSDNETFLVPTGSHGGVAAQLRTTDMTTPPPNTLIADANRSASLWSSNMTFAARVRCASAPHPALLGRSPRRSWRRPTHVLVICRIWRKADASACSGSSTRPADLNAI